MKHKLHLFSLLLLTVAFLMPTKLMAQVTQGYYTYTLSGTEATVTKCTQTSGAVVIPETIVHGGKTYNVTAIKFNSTLFLFAPTSVTANSITSITGAQSHANEEFTHSDLFIPSLHLCTAINLPKLKIIKNCGFAYNSTVVTNGDANDIITSISFPELETVDGVTCFLQNFKKLTNISLPKLKKLNAGGAFNQLPLLTSLSLPELEEIQGWYTFTLLPQLTSLNLPKLKTVDGWNTFYMLEALETLNLPELITLAGYSTLDQVKKLHTILLPKVQTIDGTWTLRNTSISELDLPANCNITSTGMLSWLEPSVTSITVRGLTKLNGSFFITRGENTLKHISLPDLEECASGPMGAFSQALESFSAPKLKKIKNSQFFSMSECPNLTTVDIPNLVEIENSQLFNDSPIPSLSLRGDLKADASSNITLNTYPTLITITDEATANDIPASFFAGVKGGRFIAPKGKAGMYATKWNLNTAKTMVYSPVEINKSTASTLYASGSITKADASFTYGGTTYKNQYDVSHAMTAAECLDASVLSVNDYGFTPTLATQTVQNGTDALAGFSFYYASAYADTPTRKVGDLTLSALSTTTAANTLQGFNATATSLNQGIGRDLGGFLFKGNNASVTEVYLPYTPTATTVTTNYLKAGEGNRVQTRQNNSHEFYWHPGDASFTMGFYESYNVLIPEYRSYLSIAKTLTSNAKRFNLIFEDGQTTGINTVNMSADDNSATSSDAWYTLQGTRLPAKPTAAGIYINGGRKVVIK